MSSKVEIFGGLFSPDPKIDHYLPCSDAIIKYKYLRKKKNSLFIKFHDFVSQGPQGPSVLISAKAPVLRYTKNIHYS